MCKPFLVTCSFALMIGIFTACQATDREETVGSAGSSKPAEEKQYRGVCLDKEAHGDNAYVLTKWLDSEDKVLIYSREHERKNKGHVTKIEERVKPEKVPEKGDPSYGSNNP